VTALGGTLFQVVIQAAFLVSFWRHVDRYAAAFPLCFWRSGTPPLPRQFNLLRNWPE